MIYKQKTNNELYIFMNGKLLLKKWYSSFGKPVNRSKVFCDAWGSHVIE